MNKLINWLLGKKESETTLKCPNCGNDQWYQGPGGGSFGNIRCGNCGKTYNNLGPFSLHEITPFVK